MNLFERHLLDRRAGDDEAVEFVGLDVVEIAIELVQIDSGGIFGGVTFGGEENGFDLDGRVAEQPEELRFRGFLGGHQVEDGDVQRANVLRQSAALIHDEDVFLGQNRRGGEAVGDVYGHARNIRQGLAERKGSD